MLTSAAAAAGGGSVAGGNSEQHLGASVTFCSNAASAAVPLSAAVRPLYTLTNCDRQGRVCTSI